MLKPIYEPSYIITDFGNKPKLPIKAHCLYVWKRDGTYLYVGITNTPAYRLTSHHIISKLTFKNGDRVELFIFDDADKQEMQILESVIIDRNKPIYNTVKPQIPNFVQCIFCGNWHRKNSFNGYCNVRCKRWHKKGESPDEMFGVPGKIRAEKELAEILQFCMQK